jgi:hypothetical protein
MGHQIILVLFCYPATSVVDPDPSALIFGSWIRIQEGKNYPGQKLPTKIPDAHCNQCESTTLLATNQNSVQ